ncbi:MAG: hypothetical protein WBC73_21070 [Phormidesmis sp.]
MSLPIVLEIAVGLIFIYLTLSLIASEIQEILSALFQWRAEHLKRSIEQLLAGDELSDRTYRKRSRRDDDGTGKTISNPGQHRRAAKALADELYDSPLIENLNYEAQGRIAGILRGLLHTMGAIYRTVTFSRNVFGRKTSGPSYIPAETFATSLIERLRLEDFQRLLVRSRFDDFVHNEVRIPVHEMINTLRARLSNEELLVAEMTYFDRTLNQISADLDGRRLTLEMALDQLGDHLRTFESMAADSPLLNLSTESTVVQSFLKRLRYLRESFSSSEGQSSKTQVLISRLRPSLGDLTALLDPDSPTYNELVALAQREGGAILNVLETLQKEVLPPQLRQSLATLGSRAEAQIRAAGKASGDELHQLQSEIETWFDNAMERASGVYRRNGKGVGLLIGLAIAFTLNADTLYMFQRLTTDQAIRNSIVQTAEQLEIRGIDSPEALASDLSIDELSERMESNLRSIGTAVEDTLADYPLPIGRTQSVLAAQQAAEDSWPIPLIPQRLVGWLITALALSMGASFWFDLLRKVTSVRSSGNPPKS